MDNVKMSLILRTAGVTESNCMDYSLGMIDGEFVVNQDGYGINLECLEGGSLDIAWDYLQDCF